MKQVTRWLALGTLIAACGGKAAPTTAGGDTTDKAPAAASIPAGIHGCAFILEGETYGSHRCDVADGSPRRLDKLSGMETFSATFSESADGVTVTAKGGCGDLHASCNVPFTIELARDGSSWRGPVTADASADWWLAGSTFEITDAAGYGGDSYGGAPD